MCAVARGLPKKTKPITTIKTEPEKETATPSTSSEPTLPSMKLEPEDPQKEVDEPP